MSEARQQCKRRSYDLLNKYGQGLHGNSYGCRIRPNEFLVQEELKDIRVFTRTKADGEVMSPPAPAAPALPLEDPFSAGSPAPAPLAGILMCLRCSKVLRYDASICCVRDTEYVKGSRCSTGNARFLDL